MQLILLLLAVFLLLYLQNLQCQGNAFVNLAFSEAWSVRASAKNFTDEYVIQTGSRGFLGGFIPIRPREYFLSVNYKVD
ncbi:MAG: hypothetical protein ACO3P5_01970 [Steroidobacteraceae bacterium]